MWICLKRVVYETNFILIKLPAERKFFLNPYLKFRAEIFALEEEKQTDAGLSQIAENHINWEAEQEPAEEEE